MTGTSSEWSEEAPGADILDLDRYMRGTRPARRPQRNTAPTGGPVIRRSSSGLVVDAGAGAGACPGAGRPTSSSSSASETDKRFSHDSGLSDTSYRQESRQNRRNRVDSVTKNEEPRRGKKNGEAPRRGKSSEAHRGKSREAHRGKSREGRRAESKEARRGASREAARGKSGSDARRSSESRSSFRESLERALRDQQAQIARVAQMCELQARSGASERRSERHSERSGRRKERREPRERVERRGEKGHERASERHNGLESGRTSSGSTEFSSSSSSVDPMKRRTSECRTYKIIMSKLDELNRLFGARRAPGALVPGTFAPGSLAPGALASALPGALAPGALSANRAHGDSSVTVSDKVVGTDSPQHSARRQSDGERHRTIIVATAAVDIPPTPRKNIVTESVVRNERDLSEPASEKGMPGRFHLDDPVRLYQQAKRLEARARRSGSSSGSRDSGHDSGSTKGSHSSKGSGKAARAPSLCALCRCYWLVARRYVAQLNPVRE